MRQAPQQRLPPFCVIRIEELFAPRGADCNCTGEAAHPHLEDEAGGRRRTAPEVAVGRDHPRVVLCARTGGGGGTVAPPGPVGGVAGTPWRGGRGGEARPHPRRLRPVHRRPVVVLLLAVVVGRPASSTRRHRNRCSNTVRQTSTGGVGWRQRGGCSAWLPLIAPTSSCQQLMPLHIQPALEIRPCAPTRRTSASASCGTDAAA
mmetsp:Transcript_33988/g.67027  ORF Transcript_33988/g.67027 Transcript_33988/m.67027 type:complete len:204 (-) Transcript_33988:304-915(-)